MSQVDAWRVPEPDWVLDALRRHEGALLRYAASLVGQSRAQDVVQDAFTKLCAEPLVSVEGHLAAWLFTVCRNRALDLRRAERRLSTMDEEAEMVESPDSGPCEKVERAQNLSRVGAAMATLPSRQQEILRLKLEAGLSYKDIAEVMNLTVSNVGFILHSAIARVREHLVEPEPVARVEGGAR
ncbi:MAG: sigma-70 family RNA polymerase sigma factor [Polyangiaceae bacterium]